MYYLVWHCSWWGYTGELNYGIEQHQTLDAIDAAIASASKVRPDMTWTVIEGEIIKESACE